MIFRPIVLVCVVATTALASDETSRRCAKSLIYLTDHQELLQATLDGRSDLFLSEKWEDWENAPVEFRRSEFGDLVMVINGFEVMRGFERPYMAAIAKTAAAAGGSILNVGYGFGYIDGEIERLRAEFRISEHHIIELNRAIVEKAELWRESLPNRDRVIIHQGDWEVVIRSLKAQGIVFDAIAYDGFPRSAEELHRDFIPFFEKVMELRLVREHTGVITFYMDSPDGFGRRFTELAKSLGARVLETERVDVELPPNQYWPYPFFLTPRLSDIEYRRQ